MHHFHLGRERGKKGFFERSKHLLFAIVAEMDAYFVDVRPHPPKDGIGWVSQDLLRIVHSNWPKLIEKSVLKGVSGVDLTDEQMQELRRKSCNYAMNLDGKAIAPLLGGTAVDGSSMLCTMLASRLMNELRYHADVLRNEEVCHAVIQDMRVRGIDMEPPIEFELVLLEDLTPTLELLAVLTDARCISRGICWRGFAIVDKKTRSPIAIHDKSGSL